MAFFDKLGKTINKVGQDAFQKTKEMADTARLNSLVSDEEKRLNNNYYQIGKLYAQLHGADCEDCFVPYITAVNESLKKIDELKAEIQKLRAVANCPKCGAEVSTASKFCNACGEVMPVTEANVVQPADTVKCSRCGKFVDKKMNFCTSCGNPIVQNVENNAPVAEPVVSEEKPAEVYANKKCPNCGAELDADAGFCTECGTKL